MRYDITPQLLAERGYKLIPISKESKFPTEAFSGKDLTQKVLSDLKSYRVGVRMKDLVAIDIDLPEAHPGIDGEKSKMFLSTLLKLGIFDPKVDMFQKTDSGGIHIIYEIPMTIPNTGRYIKSKQYINGVDVKSGVNAYVIDYGRFSNTSPRQLPAALMDALTGKGIISYKPKPRLVLNDDEQSEPSAGWKDYLAAKIALAKPGERNTTVASAVWQAAYFEGVGMTAELEEIVIEEARNIGLPDKEIKTILNQAEKKIGEI